MFCYSFSLTPCVDVSVVFPRSPGVRCGIAELRGDAAEISTRKGCCEMKNKCVSYNPKWDRTLPVEEV